MHASDHRVLYIFLCEIGAEVGPAVLFFGCRRSDQDFIYQHELEQFLALGTLTRLETAFSRDQDEKVYVQHKMLANASFLYELIHSQGAYIYVCGQVMTIVHICLFVAMYPYFIFLFRCR